MTTTHEPKLSFADGDLMPAFGLGTWKSEPGDVGRAVTEAIRVGYRHFDCSPVYGNETEVGAAFAACFETAVVARDDIWITSKLWNDAHAPADVIPALERTLADLGLEWLDLYLVHWPIAQRASVGIPASGSDLRPIEDVPIAATWERLEEAVDRGFVRHIGVSNFSLPKVRALVDHARRPPEMNQVELHPYLQQKDLVASCQALGVHVTAYSPLGSRDRPERLKAADEPVLLEDGRIRDVADELGATPAQLLIAWALHRGCAVIPKSVDSGRIAENFAARELVLDPGVMERLAGLDRHRRYISGEFWAMDGSPYTVEWLWDE
jgi:alcohol dehydrogenase (NADP+)